MSYFPRPAPSYLPTNRRNVTREQYVADRRQLFNLQGWLDSHREDQWKDYGTTYWFNRKREQDLLIGMPKGSDPKRMRVLLEYQADRRAIVKHRVEARKRLRLIDMTGMSPLRQAMTTIATQWAA